MSLLSSIFGGTDEKKEAKSTPTSGLFDKQTIHVPERLHAANKHAQSVPEEENSAVTESTSAPKRKRDDVSTSEFDAASAAAAESKATKKEEEEAIKGELTVFAGNLPLNSNRKSLAKLFKSCGKVFSSRIRSVAVTGVKLPPKHAGNQALVKKVCSNTQLLDTDAKKSVQGYVVFETKEGVQAALALNNSQITDSQTGEKRRMRVDHAVATTDASRSVFVGNLPYATEEGTLQAHFVKGCEFEGDDSAIEGVRIIRDKSTHQCKGFGYVLFRDVSMVTTALRNMHESTYMKKELRVMVCGKRFKGRKGEDENPANKKQRASFEGRRSTGPVDRTGTTGTPEGKAASVSALKRILTKSTTEKSVKKARPRGEKKSSSGVKSPANKLGLSRRAAVDAKVEKRVKKLKKRISTGMGKQRGSK
jgi:nucleolar protein 12